MNGDIILSRYLSLYSSLQPAQDKERLLCSVNHADGARGGLWKYIHVQPNLWRIFNLLLNHWNIFQSKVECYWVFWIIHVTSSFSKTDQASAILVFLVVYFKGFWLLKSDEQLSCENQVPLKISIHLYYFLLIALHLEKSWEK